MKLPAEVSSGPSASAATNEARELGQVPLPLLDRDGERDELGLEIVERGAGRRQAVQGHPGELVGRCIPS